MEREIRLAQEAATLCENPVVSQFFDTVDKALFEKWLATDPKDGEGREIIYFQVDLARKFKQYFAATITNGRAASDMLDMLLKDAE